MGRRPSHRPRLLLLLPTSTYRADAFVDAATELEVDLTVASELPSSFGEHNPSGLLTLDLANPEIAAQQAAEFSQAHPVSAVFGVDDDTAVVATAIARGLGLRANPMEAVWAARDKHRQRLIAEAASVPVPRFELHDIAEAPELVATSAPYPCVLKPVSLSASRGVIRANGVEEFLAAHARLAAILADPAVRGKGCEASKYLVESFVSGPEFALEAYLNNGDLRPLALFDKPDPLEGPFFEETIYVTPSRAPARVQRELIGCAGRAAAALGLVHGPLHVELRYNEEGPWLIELAARPIGGKCARALSFDQGASLEEILLRDALGTLRGTPKVRGGASGVMMIPTPRRGRLREIQGLAEAGAVEGVEDVLITAHRGQELLPLPEGSRYLGFIFARADDPARVESSLREAFDLLAIILDD